MRARWSITASCLALLSGCIEVAAGVPNRRQRRGGASVETLPTYAWAPFDIAGSQLYISASPVAHLWKENDTTTPALTRVSAAADTVGRVDDPVAGHVIRAATDATRPTWQTSPRRIVFDNSNDRMTLHNALTAFTACHATGVCSILMKVQVKSDGATEQIVDFGNNGSAGNKGWRADRTSGNKWQVVVSNGTTNVFNCTTTFSVQAADGVVTLAFRANNASGASISKNDGTPESCARSNAPVSGDTTNTPTIGGNTGGTQFGNIDLVDLLITNTVVSDADLTLYHNYSVDSAPSTYVRQVALSSAGTPCYNFLHRWHDFTNAATLWQDTARSTPVASNNDPIRMADDRRDTADILNREIAASADANRPLWQSNGTGALYDGSNDSLILDSSDAFQGGAKTLIFIFRQDETGETSSRIASGSDYVSVSTPDYSGNPGGLAYTVIHPSSDVGSSCTLGTETGFNFILHSRDGGDWDSYCRGNGATDDGTATSNAAFTISNFGGTVLAGHEAEGAYAEIRTYNFQLSTDQYTCEINSAIAKHSGLGL